MQHHCLHEFLKGSLDCIYKLSWEKNMAEWGWWEKRRINKYENRHTFPGACTMFSIRTLRSQLKGEKKALRNLWWTSCILVFGHSGTILMFILETVCFTLQFHYESLCHAQGTGVQKLTTVGIWLKYSMTVNCIPQIKPGLQLTTIFIINLLFFQLII